MSIAQNFGKMSRDSLDNPLPPLCVIRFYLTSYLSFALIDEYLLYNFFFCCERNSISAVSIRKQSEISFDRIDSLFGFRSAFTFSWPLIHDFLQVVLMGLFAASLWCCSKSYTNFKRQRAERERERLE